MHCQPTLPFRRRPSTSFSLFRCFRQVILLGLLSTSLCTTRANDTLDARPQSVMGAMQVQASNARQIMAEYISGTYGQSRVLASRIVNTVYDQALRVGVSPLLALAVIEQESKFQPDVVNSSGATGLMQVIRRYHEDKLPRNAPRDSLKHPETNIRVGVAVLTEYLGLAGGNIREALTRYSGGSRKYAREVEAIHTKLEHMLTYEVPRPVNPDELLENPYRTHEVCSNHEWSNLFQLPNPLELVLF